MRRLPSLLALSILLVSSACASSRQARPVSERGDVIAQHQIDADGSRTVY